MTPAEWWAEFDFRRELQDRMNGKNAVKWSKEELERVKRK